MQNPIRFTQNFLHNKPLVAKLVKKAAFAQGSTILEVGPGKGIITDELARAVGRSGRVVAVELDEKLARKLALKTDGQAQIELHIGDILKFDLSQLGRSYSVFSNVPFNITSALISKLFVPKDGPEQAHLILQTDALVGKNKGGYQTETLKSLLIKPLYTLKSVHRFDPTDFTPRPGVATALFEFKRRAEPLVSHRDYAEYQDFVAFTAKDRVGEGAWLKLFSKRQCAQLADSSELVMGRGLKSQSLGATLDAFAAFMALSRGKRNVAGGAMALLRKEQMKNEMTTRAGGHHRSKSRTKRRR